MPRIANFSIWDMVASSLRRRARLVQISSQLAEAGAAAAAPVARSAAPWWVLAALRYSPSRPGEQRRRAVALICGRGDC